MNKDTSWFLDGITLKVDMPGLVILILITALIYMIWRANKTGRLDWTDMIASRPGKVSLTKLLQLVGGITSTWIMIFTTLKSNLTSELLITYLTYVGAIEGWSKFVAAKYGVPSTDAATDQKRILSSRTDVSIQKKVTTRAKNDVVAPAIPDEDYSTS